MGSSVDRTIKIRLFDGQEVIVAVDDDEVTIGAFVKQTRGHFCVGRSDDKADAIGYAMESINAMVPEGCLKVWDDEIIERTR